MLQTHLTRQEVATHLEQEIRKGKSSPMWIHLRSFFEGVCNSRPSELYFDPTLYVLLDSIFKMPEIRETLQRFFAVQTEKIRELHREMV